MTHREEQSMRRRIKSTHIADSARLSVLVLGTGVGTQIDQI